MSKRKLNPEEIETTINFDMIDDRATIFTYMKSWQSHLKRLGLKPTMENSKGGKEYQLDKNWIRKPLPPRLRKKK